MDRASKKSRRYARVADRFKLNPFTLSRAELLLLDAQITFLEAEEELRVRAMKAPLTPEHYKHLLLVSTGDENLADKEAAKLQAAQIKAETQSHSRTNQT